MHHFLRNPTLPFPFRPQTLAYTCFLWVVTLSACNAYNSDLINFSTHEEKLEENRSDAGFTSIYTNSDGASGASNSTAVLDASSTTDALDASSTTDALDASSTTDALDASSMTDAGDTSTVTDSEETDSNQILQYSCIPNPYSTAECSEICPETCNGEDDDCDGYTDEGDPVLMCTIPNTTAHCDQGICHVDACADNYRDCDESPNNGCETLLNSVTHCGGCYQNCDEMLANTSATSCTSEGTCEITSCADGFDDCDLDNSNGCERNTIIEGPCLPDTNCIRHVYGDHDYFFCSNNRIWSSARNKCRIQERGDLVHIDDEDENEFITTYRMANAWIGANDRTIEGLWLWSNNNVPFWSGSQTGEILFSQYVNFSAEQPDDAPSAADCAEILQDGTWNDTDCEDTRDFICEVGPDLCPTDSSKVDPGQCGCEVPDTDSDSDGFADCNDQCPADPDKVSAGLCGCGTVDSDSNSDGDSELDCNEQCDTDPNKLEPGLCGCGVEDDDTDSDSDGAPDCVDSCPINPLSYSAAEGCGLGYVPANIDVSRLNPLQADETTTIDCSAVLNTSNSPSFTSFCSGAEPQITLHAQEGGPELAVVALQNLVIDVSGTLLIQGTRPAVFIVFGDATISGTIDVSASGTVARGGGNFSCGLNSAEDATDAGNETGGGGGGGFGTSGGRGGNGDDSQGGDGGSTRGSASLVPLLGGCPGGAGGWCDSRGAGGGALQLSVGGSLTLTGSLLANGGNGPDSCRYVYHTYYYGGGGGGSGGGILVEATNLNTDGSTIRANGGNGGKSPDGVNGGAGSTASTENGEDAYNDANPPEWYGGSGGGGGYGRVVICNRTTNVGCL